MSLAMSQAMQEKSKRSIVFAVVATVALCSTIASAGLGRRGRGQFSELSGRVLAETAAKSQGATPLVPLTPEYRLGMLDVEQARRASGDRAEAVLALTRVLDRADRIDRHRSLVASLLAATLLDHVADCVEKDPRLLDDVRLATALRRTSFASARKPLEAERLHALWVLAGVPSQVPLQTLGFAESVTTQAMQDVNATLHEMEDSMTAGDTKRCERAAERPQGLARQVTVGPSICRNVARVVASGQRFQRLQARAAVDLHRYSTRVARLPVAL
jgi:hypothetical protein